jgi:hypothetical protein
MAANLQFASCKQIPVQPEGRLGLPVERLFALPTLYQKDPHFSSSAPHKGYFYEDFQLVIGSGAITIRL